MSFCGEKDVKRPGFQNHEVRYLAFWFNFAADRYARSSYHAGEFSREPKGGLLVLPDNSTNLRRDLICALAARYRLPADH
jgi:hypothetical protein